MASRGQSFNQSGSVALGPVEVSQSIIAACNGAQGYTVTTAGTGSIVMTRRYTPTWAILLAVIGLLFFLLGLLFLLAKNYETLTITLSPNADGGTNVFISGTASDEMQRRLTSVLSGMTSLAAKTSDAATGGASKVASVPDVDRFEQIAKFAELRDAGTLTEEEFQAEKTRILNS
jgi:hypothetical protein